MIFPPGPDSPTNVKDVAHDQAIEELGLENDLRAVTMESKKVTMQALSLEIHNLQKRKNLSLIHI